MLKLTDKLFYEAYKSCSNQQIHESESSATYEKADSLEDDFYYNLS